MQFGQIPIDPNGQFEVGGADDEDEDDDDDIKDEDDDDEDDEDDDKDVFEITTFIVLLYDGRDP